MLGSGRERNLVKDLTNAFFERFDLPGVVMGLVCKLIILEEERSRMINSVGYGRKIGMGYSPAGGEMQE